MNIKDILTKAKVWVVKLGTRICLNDKGQLNGSLLVSLAQQIQKLRNEGKQIVIVSSGAVGMGRELLKKDSLSESMPTKQALAAIGQVELMNAYKRIFGLLDVNVAQVLLTRDDLSERSRYLNARHTLRTLLEHGIIPVINENDSVAVCEIRFGDNDNLAAMIGSLIDADLVVNLTSVPGILMPDPDNPEKDIVLKVIPEITAKVEALDRKVTTKGGTGGLTSKLEAAKTATRYGGTMVIAKAWEPDVLLHLAQGENMGSIFTPGSDHLTGRKRWISGGITPMGTIRVDFGCVTALLHNNSSLLPVGITEVIGRFEEGDPVSVIDSQGQEIARGLTNYNSKDAALLMGKPSRMIPNILEHPGYDEVINRDNLVLVNNNG